MIGTDGILLRAAEMGKEYGYVKTGDAIVAIHGMLEARSGATNMLSIDGAIINKIKLRLGNKK